MSDDFKWDDLSDGLKKSILNRVIETSTGYLKVPSDIVRRVKKETGTTALNPIIAIRIQILLNRHF